MTGVSSELDMQVPGERRADILTAKLVQFLGRKHVLREIERLVVPETGAAVESAHAGARQRRDVACEGWS